MRHLPQNKCRRWFSILHLLQLEQGGKHDSVKEGVDVLEVPIKGHPVTTEEVSVKWGNKGNTQKYISNEKTCKDVCTNNF